MHCPNCGKEVQSGAAFCVSCGQKIAEQPSEPTKLEAEIQNMSPQQKGQAIADINKSVRRDTILAGLALITIGLVVSAFLPVIPYGAVIYGIYLVIKGATSRE